MAMTSRQRHLAVMRGEIPDRMPIAPRIWAWLLEYGKTHLELKAEFDYDPIIFASSGFPYHFAEAYDYMSTFPGSDYLKNVKRKVIHENKDRDKKDYITTIFDTPAGQLKQIWANPDPGDKTYGVQPNPHMVEPLIKDRSDLEKIKYLCIDNKYFPEPDFLNKVKETGEDGIVQTRICGGVDDLLVNTMGLENVLMLYYDDRKLLVDVLDFFHEYYKKMLKHTLENEADFIFEAWFNASLSTGWSPAMYRELFLDRIKEDIELTHSYGAYFHFYDDGRIMPLAQDFADSGMDMITTLTPPPAGDTNAEEIKRIMHGKTVLSGYVDCIKIRYGTPDEIREQTRYACEVLGKDGGYILGTSDSIRDGSPYENIKAFFETGLKYSRYI
ncbi:MAG: hypothetical protein JXN10_04470 [Clostridia bacterium]|nr:hypothetical protein [Clostridia bacterium]